MTNLHKVIKVIRDNPTIGNLYLTPAVSKASVRYHYYNLK